MAEGEEAVVQKSRAKPAEPNKKNSKSKRGRQETRELLLAAALELFAQKGYRGTSVRDVAGRAGVTTGAFYSNFQSKREFYIAIIDKITNTIQEIMDRMARETIERIKEKGVKIEYEFFRTPVIRLLDEAYRHSSIMHILRREGLGHDPEFQREIDRVWERFVAMIKRALDLAVASGLAKPYDTELFARAILPMAIAMCIYDAETKARRRPEIVSLVASVLHGGASRWLSWSKLEKRISKEQPLVQALK